jgi:hypothetical protein
MATESSHIIHNRKKAMIALVSVNPSSDPSGVYKEETLPTTLSPS